MCGVLAVMFEHYEEAQTFLERATSIDPPSVVAWTLLGEMNVYIPAHCCLTGEPAANTEHKQTTTTDALLAYIRYQLDAVPPLQCRVLVFKMLFQRLFLKLKEENRNTNT